MTSDAQVKRELFTVGHSDHPLPEFLSLLTQHGITALADVRSQPYSRLNPQFNQRSFKAACVSAGIRYVFLGQELGARRSECAGFEGDRVSYRRVRALPAFIEGLTRLRNGVTTNRIAIMCAERDPLACHRTILICRELRNDPIDIRHILANGSLETTAEVEARLLREWRLPHDDLFDDQRVLVERAYDKQAERIAYKKNEPTLIVVSDSQ